VNNKLKRTCKDGTKRTLPKPLGKDLKELGKKDAGNLSNDIKQIRGHIKRPYLGHKKRIKDLSEGVGRYCYRISAKDKSEMTNSIIEYSGLCVTIPVKLKEELKYVCRKELRSLSNTVEYILKNHIGEYLETPSLHVETKLTKDLIKKLNALSQKEELSVSTLIEFAVTHYIEVKEKFKFPVVVEDKSVTES
jgi:predicted DNA-binding protein